MPSKDTVNKVIAHMTRTGDSVLSLFSGLLAVSLILFSGYTLYDTFYVQRSAFSSVWDLAEFRPEIIDDGSAVLKDPTVLKEINEDYRAWLTVYDTTIDYPVYQGEDDVYYASHDMYKKPSVTGSIYMAAGNTRDFGDEYNLIYGHHMDNRAMFGGLDLFDDEDYFRKHNEAIVVTPEKVYDVKLFGILHTNAYESVVYDVGPDKDISAWKSFIRSNATIYDQSTFDSGTKFLAMSTCSSAATSGRLVVIGVMTERDVRPDPIDPDKPDDKPDVKPDEQSDIIWYDSDGNPHTGVRGNGAPLETAPFSPRGTKDRSWALVNLICMLISVYLMLPLFHIRDKFRRNKLMKEANGLKDEMKKAEEDNPEPKKDPGQDEDEPYYERKEFSRRFWMGIILEAIAALLSVVLFILTEDMRQPMILIDRWTLIMLILTLICWVTDICFIRYREGQETAENAPESASQNR